MTAKIGAGGRVLLQREKSKSNKKGKRGNSTTTSLPECAVSTGTPDSLGRKKGRATRGRTGKK